ncbi:MAG TPA: hypothetical protein VK633_14920 [Verrucomicrobiae bacterium]|nr:hypothetical protein [Verrucomicrobiae bacterium]
MPKKMYQCPVCKDKQLADGPPTCKKKHDETTMVLNVPVTKPASNTHRGVTYNLSMQAQGKEYWLNLDIAAIQALRAGSRLSLSDLAIYEKAMQGGMLTTSDTGHDGVKCEGGNQWVIKLKIATAKANNLDNCLSPLATLVSENDCNFLNFNQLVNRH